MRVSTIAFELRAWRLRLRLTQIQAANALGLSLSAYCQAEYRNSDRPGYPCNKTVALLAVLLEQREAA